MVEIKISVRADDEAKLPQIFEHIVKEITNHDYRMLEIQKTREIDGEWLCLEDGRYHWSRNERS